jgi:hypothetical protein
MCLSYYTISHNTKTQCAIWPKLTVSKVKDVAPMPKHRRIAGMEISVSSTHSQVLSACG